VFKHWFEEMLQMELDLVGHLNWLNHETIMLHTKLIHTERRKIENKPV